MAGSLLNTIILSSSPPPLGHEAEDSPAEDGTTKEGNMINFNTFNIHSSTFSSDSPTQIRSVSNTVTSELVGECAFDIPPAAAANTEEGRREEESVELLLRVKTSTGDVGE